MKIEQAIQTSTQLSLATKTVINIMYTSRLIEEAVLEPLKKYDLTIQQYNVLRILRGQKGAPANLSTLQERMVDRNSNTTRLVDKLITKGYVKRQVCKSNRRKVEIFMTQEGNTLLSTLDPITENNNKNILNTLPNETLEQVNTYLDTLRNFKNDYKQTL